MRINVTYDQTVTTAANAAQIEGAIQDAVAFYEHAFRNVNIALNVDFRWAPLAGNALAQNGFSGFELSYGSIAPALRLSANSADDKTAYATLPASDPTGVGGANYFVTTGESRVLGIESYTPTFDDTVTLGSNYSWSFNPNQRNVPGEFDAIGALEHEMSEGGMGRVGSLGSYLLQGQWTPLDLFSYASSGVRKLSGGAHYFSLDGVHLLEQFNNPVNSGDAADWLPSITGDSYGDGYPGVAGLVTPTDLRLDDILGWTRTPATVEDFNGDAVSDVLLENSTSGDIGYYGVNGSLLGWHDIALTSAAYTLVGIGDLNGDNTDDILLRNPTTGDVGFFALSNGGTGSGSGPTQGNNLAGTFAGWHDLGTYQTVYAILGTGDFTGNGTDDILFRDGATGAMAYESMSNGAPTGWHALTSSSTAYKVVGIGDFYGNGTDDILMRNNTTGDIGFYGVSNGVSTGWHDLTASPTAYSVVGVGDFTGSGNTNAHGTDDILMRNNTTGDIGYYAISNGVSTGWHDIGLTPTAYSVAGVGDYYGNGTNDILMRNATTGDTGFYAISNGVSTGWHDLVASPTAYHAVSALTAPIA